MANQLYAALYAISEHGQPFDEALLEQGLASREPSVLWLSMKIVGEHKVRTALQKVIDIALGVEWPENVDGEAIGAFAIAEIGSQEAEKAMLEASSSKNERARRFAADVFGLMRSPEGYKVLQRLCKDSAYEVRLWAFLSLSKYGSLALPFLQKLAEEVEDEVDQHLIKDAISKI